MGDFMVKAKLAQPTQADMQAAIKKVIDLVMKIFGGQQAPGVPGQAMPPAPPSPPAQPAQPAPQAGMIGG